MDLIEQIGPVLGIVAFLGLSILAFLLFQQSRDLRRLREWAGRAPERAREATEATLAASEARGEAADREAEGEPAGPLARVRELAREGRDRVVAAWTEADQALPIDIRIVAGVLAVVVVAAAVLTSGFGLVGDDGTEEARRPPPPKPRNVDVAVLNATEAEDVPAVPGLAATISNDLVEPLDYNVVSEADAPSGTERTTVMFAPGQRASARQLAKRVRRDLGEAELAPMTPEVEEASRSADVALLIGVDNSTFSAQ
jgi:LytR cell envelope-related transcriptional attenuator